MFGPIVLQVVLIFLNATFASAEIAVISMNEVKLRRLAEDGDNRAIRLVALTEQPARFLATIQVAITLAGLLGSAFAAESFSGPLVEVLTKAGVGIPANVLKSVSVFLITLILAYFNLVFGELVPKRIAMKKAESMALGISGLLHMVSSIFKPLVFLLTVSTNLVLRIIGINPEEEEEQVTEEEIRLLLMEGKNQGNIAKEESAFIQNVFELDDMSAEQVCTHRTDMVMLYKDESPEEWDQVICNSRHTHYPVCDENIDDVIGVLDTKDYFRMEERSREQIMEQAVDVPFFVPENIKANILFRQMKENRTYFSVLVDEYGGVTGIATLHDLLEELVGELHDMEEPELLEDIKVIGENRWIVRGCADIEDVTEKLEIELPTKEYDTYGGFVCGVLGKIPNDGEQLACKAYGLEIEIKKVKNHRIEETIVRKNG